MWLWHGLFVRNTKVFLIPERHVVRKNMEDKAGWKWVFSCQNARCMPNGTTGINQNKFGRGDEEKQKHSCSESSSPSRLLDNYLSRLTGPLIFINKNNNNNNNQAISKNYFKNKILKKEIDGKCRLCTQNKGTFTTYPQYAPFWRTMST